MPANTYILCRFGFGGIRVNGCAEPLEPIEDGDFTNLARARSAAAELAVMWANEPYTEVDEVRVAIVREDEPYGECLHVAIGQRGRKTARWE